MTSVPGNATAEEVQSAARHSLPQWDRFLMFTRVEALELITIYESWVDIPANERIKLRDRVNVLLRQENISEVGDDIIRWRMRTCLRDVKKKMRIASKAPVGAQTPPAATRRFDPIRDI